MHVISESCHGFLLSQLTAGMLHFAAVSSLLVPLIATVICGNLSPQWSETKWYWTKVALVGAWGLALYVYACFSYTAEYY